jgi:glutamine---fructose-6-phosphate transaminase (isomerizing)
VTPAGQEGAAGQATAARQAAPGDFDRDVLAQPRNLEEAAATILPALERAELRRFQVRLLVFTGMGASLSAAVPAVLVLRAAGRPALAMPATEVLLPGGERVGGAYVAVSQSGRSAETVAALDAVERPRLALTNATTSPLAEVADLTLPLGSAPDAGIAVLTYTASLLAAAALAGALVGGGLGLDVGRLAAAVAELLDRADPAARRVAGRLAGARAVDVAAGGFSAASAGYGALLLRETARIPAAAFDSRQYLHGPVEVAEAGVGAVLLGDGREVGLARHLAAAGAAVLLVAGGGVVAPDGVELVTLPDVPAPLRPILEAVPLQLLAGRLASDRGLVAGRFRHHQADTKTGP